jgi:hypothetical protein
MSHIIIRFIGLCTHIGQVNFPDLQPKHRMILLGFDGNELRGKPVHPHLPQLIKEDKQAVPLQRVRLSIANAKPTGFVRHASFLAAVPHLDHSEKLEPKDGVLYAGDPPVQAYFDVDDGELHACIASANSPKPPIRASPAIGTWLRVETEGDPILQVTGLHSDEVTLWPFAHRSVIGIHNIATGGADSAHDYLINYLAFEEPAELPQPPPEPDPGIALDHCPVLDPEIDLTSSCSNTGFP